MTAKHGSRARLAGSGSLVDGLARSVILKVNATPHERRHRRIEIAANILSGAVLDSGRFDEEATRQDLAALRISPVDIIDHCIPSVAQAIGVAWVEDRLSFAKVSIASARLFGLCKLVGHEWDNLHPTMSSRTLLLATMDREDHIIGPAVLAEQLRRRGHSVLMHSNATAESLCDRVGRERPDAVMISVSTWQALESAGKAIRRVKSSKPGTLVILGGSALGDDERRRPATGADLTTNDIDEALDAITGDDISLRVAE